MDPPKGYIMVTCPRCGHGYQTLEAAPVAFCSVACADTAHRPATPPPKPSHLFRAVRCSYCWEPMRVAPRLRPPFRCPRCAGWRRSARLRPARATTRTDALRVAGWPPAPPPGQPAEPEQPAHQWEDRHGGMGAVCLWPCPAPRRGRLVHQQGGARRTPRSGCYPDRQCGAGGTPEVRAPDAVVPDIYDAVLIEVGEVAGALLPEV